MPYAKRINPCGFILRHSIGGFSLGLERAGFKTVVFCEQDKFCQKVLKKHWPEIPIEPDIKDFSFASIGNDDECWGCICERIDNKKLILETLNWLKRQSEKKESQSNAYNAIKKFPCLQALLAAVEDGSFAHGDADEHICAENTEQTLAAESGCVEIKTRIGNTVMDMKGTNATQTMTLFQDGEEGFLQEINTPVKNASSNQKEVDNLTHTTSRGGQNTPNLDLLYQTALRFVKSVMGNCTKRRRRIDIITAGVPCQPASCAGKRRGREDDRWLWGEAIRVLAELNPRWAIFENVAGLLSLESGMAFEHLLLDVEAQGYSVQAFIIPACAVNAPHRRDRVWIVANSISDTERGAHGGNIGKCIRGRQKSNKCERNEMGSDITNSDCHAADTEAIHVEGCERGQGEMQFRGSGWGIPWLEVASEFCGIYDGISDWIHRHYDRIISEEDYETTTTKDRTEGVQILWKAIQSEEIWEQVGRILQIPKKGILLTLLFYFQGESIKKGEQVESAEMGNNKVLRNLWNNSGFKCSSQRLKLHEQRGKELTDIMPELSFQTARIFAKITDYIICGESTMSNSNRVNRLKALGNAVVPQIVTILGETILRAENENL